MLKTMTVRATVAGILAGLWMSAHAIADTQRIDIPAGSLLTALETLAKQANVDLVYQDAQVQGLRTDGVAGDLSARDAVVKLLEGTPLKIRQDEESGAILIMVPAASAPGASSRSSTDQVIELEELVVTGSHIRGAATDGPSPVVVFDTEAIERTGAATMQQFFEKVPQNFGGGANTGNVGFLGVDRDVGSNFGQGSSINLRGLGTGTTLTLINGHRVSSSNRYQYVDVSLIPLSAVERVEILTDGASAIYGADAVGGVVNIILRRDFTGYETGLRYGTVTTGGLEEYQASQAAGWSWSGGHALASYEFLEQDNLSAADKDFSSNATFQPYDLYPASKRHSLYLDGAQRINDILAVNLAGSFAKRDVDTTIASSSNIQNMTPRTRQYDLFAGLTLDLPRQWQARLNGGYGNSDVRYERTRIAGGVASTAAPTDMNSSTRNLELAADGDLLALPAGSVRAAIGASYREDEYDFIDYRAAEPSFNVSREVTAFFGEVNIPLLKDVPGARRLSLSAAARHDDYSDFGSTTNPKFGLLWEAVPGLAFRTSYGRSYRAPVFEDMQPNNFAQVFRAPNPSAPGGGTIVMLIENGNPNLGPERAKTWTGGFSFEPRAIPGLMVQANYYHIDYSGRIDSGYAGDIANLLIEPTEPYAPILTFDPTLAQIEQARQMGLSGFGLFFIRTGPFAVPAELDEFDTEVILDNRIRNNAVTSQRGIDLNASYSIDAGQSRIALSLAGQYILESTRRVTSAAPEADALNVVYLPVDLKMRGGAALTRHNLMGGIFMNYVDGYRDPSNIAQPKVDSWITVDVNLKYSLVSTAGSAGRTSLALNVQNILDRDPPFIVNRTGTGYDPTNATPLGRFVSIALTHRW
jgi:iron complex outermembrane recepter protein